MVVDGVMAVSDKEWLDDATATTAALTDLADSDSDGEDMDAAEDFAAENAPRPPPDVPLYNGKGKPRRHATAGTGKHNGSDSEQGRSGGSGSEARFGPEPTSADEHGGYEI